MDRTDTGLRTDDIFKTSYGVGHHSRFKFYFPSHEKKSHLQLPLTRNLNKGNEITPQEHFKTTNQYYHDKKLDSEPLKQEPRYSKAPSLTKVNYMKDCRHLLNERISKRSLSPRNQLTETQEEFSAPVPLSVDVIGMKNFLFHEYDEHEFNKEMFSDKIEDKWGGGYAPVTESEVLRNIDPYLTTNQKMHRIWNTEELKGYAKNDVTTHWETNGFPKTRGFGNKSNPIPLDSCPRQEFPMRDEIQFPSATKINRVKPAPVNVPHTGLKTLYMDSFNEIHTGLDRAKWVCPVRTPWILHDPSTNFPNAAPLMYKTEASTIGDCNRHLL